MSARVRLTVLNGQLAGTEFLFEKAATCLVGRASDCQLRLLDDQLIVSRRHCLLTINPPQVHVRDQGSRNGTFVNGVLIGRRAPGQPPGAGSPEQTMEHPLHSGDELRLGDTVLRIEVAGETAGDSDEAVPAGLASVGFPSKEFESD
jgi:pSer/pThr/pTyr-binding forkhead associated (FHA) protein